MCHVFIYFCFKWNIVQEYRGTFLEKYLDYEDEKQIKIDWKQKQKGMLWICQKDSINMPFC